MFKSVTINVKETLEGYEVAISHEGAAPAVGMVYSQQEIETMVSRALSHTLRVGTPFQTDWSEADKADAEFISDHIGNVVPMPNSGVMVTRPISPLTQEEIDSLLDVSFLEQLTAPTPDLSVVPKDAGSVGVAKGIGGTVAPAVLKDARIVASGFQNQVYGIYPNGEETYLFAYFADELYFSTYEFEGLTREEALDLFVKKDTAYLRS